MEPPYRDGEIECDCNLCAPGKHCDAAHCSNPHYNAKCTCDVIDAEMDKKSQESNREDEGAGGEPEEENRKEKDRIAKKKTRGECQVSSFTESVYF
ncbi:hypothetical protein L218DRAFT_956124 [Marasmius fiardii PR-910]|nr:hypothetical protein L218DRAFT_956124 [Marasmius fiardii PR-910]